MKEINSISFLICLLIILLAVNSAFALLEDNGNGTITQTRNDGSILMWLKDANAAGSTMTWDQANTWIDTLNSSSYLGYSDWRLPDTRPVNGTGYNYNWSYDGSTDVGYNITSPNSEMAYLFYTELENLGHYDTSGNDQTGWGLSNTGPFENFLASSYWSGIKYANYPDHAWHFNFGYGIQDKDPKGSYSRAWAVRVVPEPISSVLFIAGGTVLIGRLYLRRKQKYN